MRLLGTLLAVAAVAWMPLAHADEGEQADVVPPAVAQALVRDAAKAKLNNTAIARVRISEQYSVEWLGAEQDSTKVQGRLSVETPGLSFVAHGATDHVAFLDVTPLPAALAAMREQVQWLALPAASGRGLVAHPVVAGHDAWRAGRRIPVVHSKLHLPAGLALAYNADGECLGIAIIDTLRDRTHAMVYGAQVLRASLGNVSKVAIDDDARKAASAAVRSAIVSVYASKRRLSEFPINSLKRMSADHPWAPDELERITDHFLVSDGAGEALAVLKSIRRVVRSPARVAVIEGALLLANGRSSEGRKILKSALEDPQTEWKARLLLLTSARGGSLQADITDAVFPLPDGPCPERLEGVLGHVLWKVGRAREAARVLASVAAHERAPAKTRWEYGRALISLGEWSKAEAVLRKALADANAPVVWRADLGLALEMLGRLPEAEVECSAALAAHPKSAVLRLGRADVRAQRGNRTGAVADLDQAVVDEPDSALVWFTMGLIAGEVGDQKRVASARERLRTLDPDALERFEAELLRDK